MINHTFNADFEGDTPHGLRYPIVALPIVKQRQILISKKALKKLERQFFNNLSLSRKVEVCKIGILGAKLIMR